MLVFGREISECIDITTPRGERVTIMLVRVLGDRAKIGVEAPKEFTVHRREVQRAIDERQLLSATLENVTVRVAGAGPLVPVDQE